MLVPVPGTAPASTSSLLQDYRRITDAWERILRNGAIDCRLGGQEGVATAALDLLAAWDELEPQRAALRAHFAPGGSEWAAPVALFAKVARKVRL